MVNDILREALIGMTDKVSKSTAEDEKNLGIKIGDRAVVVEDSTDHKIPVGTEVTYIGRQKGFMDALVTTFLTDDGDSCPIMLEDIKLKNHV